jgi:NADH dehydrogenase
VFPVFGDGGTRLQPVFVGDVAEAAAAPLAGPDQRPGIHELGGPEVRTYRALVELVMRHWGRRYAIPPVPFPVWERDLSLVDLAPSMGEVEPSGAVNLRAAATRQGFIDV